MIPDEYADTWSRVLVSITDITERKKLENELLKLSRAVEQSPESVVITDAEGRIEYVNNTFCKVTGYAVDEVMGQNPRVLRSGETSADVYKDLWATISAGGVWQGELVNRRKSGDLFWEEAVISGVTDESGKVLHYVALKRDISDQKRLQVEREELEARLRQSQKLETVGTLAGGIAHDFNNLLTPILGYAEMAKMHIQKDSRAAEYMDRIHGAANRSKDLVKQILMFSRRVEQEKKPIELAPVVEEALKLIRASIPSTIRIESTICESCGVVMADPGQIHQVLMNLCTNSYHAMEESGGVLTRRAGLHSHERRCHFGLSGAITREICQADHFRYGRRHDETDPPAGF